MTRLFKEDHLLIGSHNQGKIAEFEALLAPYVGSFKNAAELKLEEPEETGETFKENALIKAVTLAKETGLPTLADDSGFCVEALNGAPGVYSGRYAVRPEGGARDFAYAHKKIWDQIKDQDNRRASFQTVLCLAWPDGEVVFAKGVVEGAFTYPARGSGGFGYDPVFVPQGWDKTFAEVPREEKQAISHRGRAFEVLIKEYFDGV